MAVGKAIKSLKEDENKKVIEQEGVKIRENWDTRMVKAAEHYDDFDETIENDKIPLHPVVTQVFMEAGDIGPHMAYWWGKHPKEAKELVALSKSNPIKAAAELGKIEDKIATALAAKENKSPASSKPKEKPAPINPVGGSGTITTVKNLDELSYQDYKKERRKQKQRR